MSEYLKQLREEIKELEKEVLEIRAEFIQLLQKHAPEYISMYAMRLEYALDPHYPEAMRLHNLYEVLRMYAQLKALEK